MCSRTIATVSLALTLLVPGIVDAQRVDTITVPRVATRVDTVVRIEPLVPPPVRGPLYAGMYAGTAAATGNLDRLYARGLYVGTMLGWQQSGNPLSARVRADATQLDRESRMAPALVGTRSPIILGLGVDVKMQLPPFDVWAPYAVGGAGISHFRGMATASGAADAMCGADERGGCYSPANDERWSTEFAYGFGVGIDLDFGLQGFFVEARAQAIQSRSAQSWLIPLSLGYRFF
jgi:hypothetical protein